MNLVEVGGRVQGLDGILEKFFTKDEEEDNIINLEGLDEINNKVNNSASLRYRILSNRTTWRLSNGIGRLY